MPSCRIKTSSVGQNGAVGQACFETHNAEKLTFLFSVVALTFKRVQKQRWNLEVKVDLPVTF